MTIEKNIKHGIYGRGGEKHLSAIYIVTRGNRNEMGK